MDRVWLRMPASERSNTPERIITGFWQPWVVILAGEYHSNGTYLGEYPTGEGWGCWWDTDEGEYYDYDEDGELCGDHEAPDYGPTHWAPMEPPEFP